MFLKITYVPFSWTPMSDPALFMERLQTSLLPSPTKRPPSTVPVFASESPLFAESLHRLCGTAIGVHRVSPPDYPIFSTSPPLQSSSSVPRPSFPPPAVSMQRFALFFTRVTPTKKALFPIHFRDALYPFTFFLVFLRSCLPCA